MRGLGLSWGFIARRLGFHPEGRRGAPAPSMHRGAHLGAGARESSRGGAGRGRFRAVKASRAKGAALFMALARADGKQGMGWDGMGDGKQRREQYGGRRQRYF